MRRYFDRSLRRMMKEFILEKDRDLFPHNLLMKKQKEFTNGIPGKLLRIKGISKHGYYSLIRGVRELLREEDKKVLINQRGIGYKLADDYEKEIESYVQLERGMNSVLIGKEIMDVIDIKKLDERQKGLFNVLKNHIEQIGGVQIQLINDLREKRQLPEKIGKQLAMLMRTEDVILKKPPK